MYETQELENQDCDADEDTETMKYETQMQEAPEHDEAKKIETLRQELQMLKEKSNEMRAENERMIREVERLRYMVECLQGKHLVLADLLLKEDPVVNRRNRNSRGREISCVLLIHRQCCSAVSYYVKGTAIRRPMRTRLICRNCRIEGIFVLQARGQYQEKPAVGEGQMLERTNEGAEVWIEEELPD